METIKQLSLIEGSHETHMREAKEKVLFYDGLYAPSGFDIMAILMRVVSRPNPQIDLGPVDCSAAIIVCDTFQLDAPIVYCSEAFTHLTGYAEREVLGRNCRFLQSPAPSVELSMDPKSPEEATASIVESPSEEVLRLKMALDQRQEVQATVRNYTKGGKPFANLVTVIPVQGQSNTDRVQYMVGFQACLKHFPEPVP